MQVKFKLWHLAAAAVVAGGTLGTWQYLSSRSLAQPRAMLACLPRAGAVSVYLDIDGLRRFGILDTIAGSKAAEDLEYKKFVEGTGFDYRRDLKALAGAFSGHNSHLVLRGKFDWKRLAAYAIEQGGKCNANSVCRVAASNGRFVSFYPLRSGVMALAVSTDEWAALDIAPRQSPEGAAVPDQPVWVAVSGAALRDVTALPAGARAFVSPLESADHVAISIGPANQRFQVNLNVACSSDTVASDIVTRLEGATNMLRKLLARENMKPSPRDLSGVLTGGTFRRDGRFVTGSWPMQRDFIEAVVSGRVD
jgi:hypothetical protein